MSLAVAVDQLLDVVARVYMAGKVGDALWEWPHSISYHLLIGCEST